MAQDLHGARFPVHGEAYMERQDWSDFKIELGKFYCEAGGPGPRTAHLPRRAPCSLGALLTLCTVCVAWRRRECRAARRACSST